MNYPITFNGDHAEFELEHANTKPEDRPDWPLPSFDARDWAAAFCKINPSMDEGTMLTWFANALMRGHDEHAARAEVKAWRWRHGGRGPWTYGEEKPSGPSAHLFEVEALRA